LFLILLHFFPFSGYGHIAPVTSLGRLVTIIYAIFGIPILLMSLADFGKLFTRMVKAALSLIRRLYYTGTCRRARRTVPLKVKKNPKLYG
jgi:hypothetical protein